MEKRDEILILRVSPSDKERIRMKMEELGISNMDFFPKSSTKPSANEITIKKST